MSVLSEGGPRYSGCLKSEESQKASGVLGSPGQATWNLVMREALANLGDFVWLVCCLLVGR